MALTKDLVLIGLSPQEANFVGDTASDTLTATGGVLGTALALTSSINCVTTVAGGADGVRLPAIAATPYSAIMIRNDHNATTLKVYPASTSEFINALTGGTNTTIGAGAARVFYKVSATKWVST